MNERTYLRIHLVSISLCVTFITAIANSSRRVICINIASSIYIGKYSIAFCLLLIQGTCSFSKCKLFVMESNDSGLHLQPGCLAFPHSPRQVSGVPSTPHSPVPLSANVFPSFPESPCWLRPITLQTFLYLGIPNPLLESMNQPSKVTHHTWYMGKYFSGNHPWFSLYSQRVHELLIHRAGNGLSF